MSVSTASANPAESPSLTRRILLFYGFPGLVTALPSLPVFTLAPGFYAEYMGLGLAVTGLVLFLSRSLDVVSDPLIGWLADRNDGAGLRRMVL